MKIARIIATAGLMIASLGITTAAEAKDHGRSHEYSRGHGGPGRSYGRHDNGNHYGWRNGRGHRNCYTQWRHHRQVRVCR